MERAELIDMTCWRRCNWQACVRVGVIDLPGHAGNLPVQFEIGLSELDADAILETAILLSHRARLSAIRTQMVFWS